jgi:hypothetical protein
VFYVKQPSLLVPQTFSFCPIKIKIFFCVDRQIKIVRGEFNHPDLFSEEDRGRFFSKKKRSEILQLANYYLNLHPETEGRFFDLLK